MQLFILQGDSVHQGSILKYNTTDFYFFFTLWLWIVTYMEGEHKIHFIYIYLYKHLKGLDSQSNLFQKNMSEMKDELDSLVAHRKQTSSSGNQILFQAWHIKGKEGSEWGVKNVIWSHRGCWQKPSSLQTNKIERLEVNASCVVTLYTHL